MAFQVSPGVEVKEIDLTNVIPAVSTSIGAFAGHFSWGPVGEVKLVSSEKELINEYGAPVDTTTGGQYDNYTSFLQAASFLKYSNTLRISRACSADALNAAGARHGSLTSAKLINNKDVFDGTTFSGAKPGVVHARCPGTAGNSLQFKTAMAIVNGGSFDDSTLNNNVSSQASTTAWAASNVASDAKDEVHIAIIDEDGVFSGVKGTILEIYEGLSLYSDAVKDGGSNYYKTVINRDSKYVFINEAAFAAEFTGSTHAAPGTAGSTGKKFNSANISASGINTVTSAVTSDATSGATAGTYTISSEDTGVVLSDNTASGASFSITISLGSGGINADTITIVNNGTGFAANDTITIPETLLGSSQGDADETIVLTVASVTSSNSEFSFSLVNGKDGSSVSDASKAGNITTALTQFQNPEAIDINLLFAEVDADGVTTIGDEVTRICGTARKDCVGFISPHTSANTAATVVADFDYNNSYVVLDSSAVYVYNKYNDTFRYIPANGHIAGLCARTDDTNDPWFSPAGYNRGNLLGVTKLKWNPTKSDRDTLYKAGVNPIISEPGQGILLFGDKTAQSKPSAFDRINVRRLFVVLEKAISTASKFQLFELNDEFTRAMFRNMTEPFLRDVKGRRGITDFLVVCDETNNTGAVIDANRFVADIYIKPARSINFITLNFVATRTGVEFSEIVGTGN
tara:strand:- start:2060 stop:4126 length:2067 start_codon:yes stop_codon:yes gene_type:complete